MAFTLSERPRISEGDVDSVSIDYTEYLDSGETISTASTPTEVTTTDLTLGAPTVNAAAATIKGRSVAIGKAITFSVQGQQAGTTYTVRTSVVTSASRTKKLDVKFITAS